MDFHFVSQGDKNRVLKFGNADYSFSSLINIPDKMLELFLNDINIEISDLKKNSKKIESENNVFKNSTPCGNVSYTHLSSSSEGNDSFSLFFTFFFFSL
jgi:hypothetical protein